MTATTIDGKVLSTKIKEGVKVEVADFLQKTGNLFSKILIKTFYTHLFSLEQF